MSDRPPPPPEDSWVHAADSAFQGRSAERESFSELVAAARRGLRQVVFVSGDAGLGKSRLTAEVIAPLVADGSATVMVGHCLPDYPVAYEPFRGPIGTMLAATDSVLDPDRREEVRSRLTGLLAGLDASISADDGERTENVRVYFDAVVDVLAAMSRARLVVLVLEDLHWATPSTTALLSHVVRRLTQGRLLVVATFRSDPPDRSEDLAGAVAELLRVRGVHRIALSGLDTAAVEALLRSEAQVSDRSSGPLAARLRAQTGGNPFLLLQICNDLREHDDDAAIPVPATVRDSIASRLARLADADRWLVELAAVLGQRVSIPLLRECAPEPERAEPAIENAVDLGLVIADTDGRGLRFPHALARQAVLDVLDTTAPIRHASLHAVAARTLQARPAPGLPEVRRLAYHFAHAHTLAESRERTREYLLRAAALAEGSFAYDEAASHYEQVAELTDSPRERENSLQRVVDCQLRSGRFTAAMDISERLTQRAADPAARLRAAVAFEAAAAHRGGQNRAVELLKDALDSVRVDVADETCLLALAGLSRALAMAGETHDALGLAEATLYAARARGDVMMLARVLHRLLRVTQDDPRSVTSTLARARELAHLAHGNHNYRQLGIAGLALAWAGFVTGDPAAVSQAAADQHLAADRTGFVWFEYFAAATDVGAHFLTGDFARAEHLARRARDASVDWPESETDHLYGTQMFGIRRETGRLDTIAAQLTGREAFAEHWAPGLLGLYTEAGKTTPVRRLLEVMGTPEALAANRGTPFWPAALAHLSEAALLVGDDAVLRRLRPLLAEHSGFYLVPYPAVGFYGSADRYLALVDAALDQGDPLALLDAAEALDRRAGASVHLATTLATRARFHASREGPRSRHAAIAAEEARAIAAPIGQTRVLKALDDISSPTTTPAAGRRPDDARATGLTERESDVLRLLVEGASNREIARALSISESTAANHVRSILAKTNTSSRARAVHHAVTHGLLDSE